MATEKTCFKCQESKPLTEFYPHARMADGHLNKCKACAKRDALEHRLLNLAECRAYDRRRASQGHRVTARQVYQRTEAYKVANKKSSAKYIATNPVRRFATHAVSNAIRDGRLTREPCFICGARAEAHHADYSAPLAVTWLCDDHHKQLHAEARAYRRAA